jgi:hypothetical protein
MSDAARSPWHLILTLLLAGFVAADLVGRTAPKLRSYADSSQRSPARVGRASVPAQAQTVDQKGFNVLPAVLPPARSNASTVRKMSVPY